MKNIFFILILFGFLSSAYAAEHDVAVLSLSTSLGNEHIVVAAPFAPLTTVKNFGTSNAKNIAVFVTISNPGGLRLYTDTIIIDLSPQEEKSITFRECTPNYTGKWRITAYSVLMNDENLSNDTVWQDFPAVDDTSKDVMAVTIIDPLPGSTKPRGVPFQVTASFKFVNGLLNYPNVPVRLEIIPCLDSFVTFGTDSLIPLVTKDSALITFAFSSSHGFESTKYLDTGCYKIVVSIMDWFDSNAYNNKVYSTFQIIPPNSTILTEDAGGIEFLSNFPNPFSATTTLTYEVASSGYVTMRILNETGVTMQTIMSDAFVSEGKHEATLDGTHLPSGTYFVEMVFRDASGNLSREVQPVTVRR